MGIQTRGWRVFGLVFVGIVVAFHSFNDYEPQNVEQGISNFEGFPGVGTYSLEILRFLVRYSAVRKGSFSGVRYFFGEAEKMRERAAGLG